MRVIIRKIWYWSWGIIALVLILFAIVVSCARIILPYASKYKNEIESAVSQVSGYTVEIETIGAAWDILEPGLKLSNVRVYDKNTHAVILSVDDVIVTIGLVESLIERAIVADDIIIIGTELSAVRDSQGNWNIQGFVIPANNEELEINLDVLNFLQGKELRLLDSVVSYKDELLKFDYRFDSVNISMLNSGNAHNIYLSVNLPQHLGKTLGIGLELSGSLQKYNDLTGDAYIRGVGINVAAWTQKLVKQMDLHAGVADFEIWLDWDEHKPQVLQGKMAIQDIRRKELVIDNFSTDFFAEKRGEEYFFNLDNFTLVSGKRVLESYGLTLMAGITENFTLSSLRLAMDYMSVGEMSAIIDPWLAELHPESSRILRLSKPSGEFQQVYLHWTEQGLFEASTVFENIEAQASDNVFSIKDLSGSLKVKNKVALVTLDSKNISAESSHLFRVPLLMDKLQGDVTVWSTNQAIALFSERLDFNNAHIAGDLRVGMLLQKGASPYLNLTANYYNGDAAFTPRYLPLAHMSVKVVDWLDTAVVSGRVVKGDAEIRGDMSKYPFYNKEGIFRIEFDIEDFVLNYKPGWPGAKSLSGHAKFDGPGLFVDIHNAEVDGLTIVHGTGVFDDLKVSALQLELIEQGSVDAAVKFIRNSPLRNSFAAVIDEVEGGGDQLSVLSMTIDMHGGKNSRIAGVSNLFNTEFKFPNWALTFNSINTRFFYSDTTFDADPFSALLNNKPVAITINTQENQDTAKSIISLQGSLSGKEMLSHHYPPLAASVSGDFTFTSIFEIPLKQNGDNVIGAQLILETDLIGLSSVLPVPMNKEKSEPLLTKVTVDFIQDKQAVVDVEYDHWLRGAIILHKPLDHVVMLKSDWRLNSERPVLPLNNELTVNGELPYLNLDAWEALKLFKDKADDDLIIKANVKVNDLTYLGRSLQSVYASLHKDQQGTRIVAVSEALKGEINLPPVFTETEGVEINLDYIDFNKLTKVKEGSTDPELIPPIQFSTKKFLFEGVNLENVRMTSLPVANGLKLETLIVDDPYLKLRADGEWLNKNGGQTSGFNITVESKNAGEGLGRLGYAKLVKGGNGEASFNVYWEAAPSDFDLGLLWGSSHISFQKGQLVDLEPGAGGRLFGLISLQALPRRLAFDFKDVFSKGFNFDKMRGNFSFANGNAYTTDFMIDGSIGRIDIRGRTGLKAKDYDQSVTVLPDLSSSLPVVGAVLAGASGGLAMIVIDRVARLFGKQTDHLGQAHYSITGSWEEPVIERIKMGQTNKQAAETGNAKK